MSSAVASLARPGKRRARRPGTLQALNQSGENAMSRYQIAVANLDRRREGAGFPLVPQNWEWNAPHLSRRISGISEVRAKDLVARNGGSAGEMRVS
jgi:hypothetical protein